MIRPVFVDFAALLAPAVVFTAIFSQGPGTSTDPEVQRLRRHFATVEQELLARDVSHLSPARRAARVRHIERLRAYARAGVFPRNTDYAGQRVPYFIDRFGTRCAMAYLIEQSGSGEYVRRVAERMNNAHIADIARDPELGAPLFLWLSENGLTVAEAARIQPEYCWVNPPCPEPTPTPQPASASTGYKVGTGAAIASGLSSLALNSSLLDLGLPRRTTGWLGVGAGALGLVLGAVALEEGDDSYKAWGIANGGVGALALGFGLKEALRGSPPLIAGSRKDAAPTVSAGPWIASGGGAGALVNVRF